MIRDHDIKQKKVDFQKQGMDPSIVRDKMWWLDPSTKKYEVLDGPVYQKLVLGKARL